LPLKKQDYTSSQPSKKDMHRGIISFTERKRDKFMCRRRRKKWQAKPDRKSTVIRRKGVARKALKVTVCIGFLSLPPACLPTPTNKHTTQTHTTHSPRNSFTNQQKFRAREKKNPLKKPALQIPSTELPESHESPQIFPISDSGAAAAAALGRFPDRARREFQAPYAEWSLTPPVARRGPRFRAACVLFDQSCHGGVVRIAVLEEGSDFFFLPGLLFFWGARVGLGEIVL
jgi:hypothetical protein